MQSAQCFKGSISLWCSSVLYGTLQVRQLMNTGRVAFASAKDGANLWNCWLLSAC
jgi:hypothetical protein